MRAMPKFLSVLSLLVVVCVLGAAVASSDSGSGRAPLGEFGVQAGTMIRVLENIGEAKVTTDNLFTVIEVQGWHVLASRNGKRGFAGRNEFVLNLEDLSFQIVRQPGQKKK